MKGTEVAISRRKLLAASAATVPLGSATAAVLAATPAEAAGFGYTSSGGYYTVNTGAGLIFKISQTNGDLTSLNYNGTELQPSGTKGSHVESGLGSTATVTATQTGNHIIVTESVTNWYGSGSLVHYFVVVNGQNTIYMATYADSAGGGELRWIQYLNRSVLSSVNTSSDISGGTTIESQDIYQVGSETRSKYYSNRRALELTPRGVTGSGIGVHMVYGNRESSAGGPFFRDIEQQGTNSSIELYNYLFSAHNQTESQRLGVLYGPYALMVGDTSTPSAPDMTFMYGLGLRGAVDNSSRGYASGKASGMASGSSTLVGFANGTAQYWCTPDGTTGNFSSPMMKPGTYTQTLYLDELAVATRTVAVSADAATTGQDITSAWTTPTALFRIGDWSGTPVSFKNGSRPTSMHPSDARMSSWGPTTYTVGSSSTADFPAYQWKDVNNPTTVEFTLTSAQLAARTVRIGITAAYAGGRPRITVNNWTSPPPAPPASQAHAA